MKKIFVLLLLMVFLTGCATYKFQMGQEPYENGYVAIRDYRTIPEYTIGKDNIVPDNLDLAKERFKRRKRMVEHYYKKMEIIESKFVSSFWGPIVLIGKTISGVFRLPFIAYQDYKYNRDPEYKKRVQRQDEQDWALDKAHMDRLKSELELYIQEDLAKEQ